MTSGRRGWMGHGSCLDTPGLPWTCDTDRVPTVLVEEMTAICGTCPVRLACAAHVCTGRITGGFWAGADRDPFAVSGDPCVGTEQARLGGLGAA